MTKQSLDQIKTINQLDKLLKAEGYQVRKNGGSHVVYSAMGKNSVSVPTRNNGNIAPGTMRDIKKQILGNEYYLK